MTEQLEELRLAEFGRRVKPYDFLDLFDPGTPQLVEVYLGSVEDMKKSREEPILLLRRKAVGRFIDVILENLIVSTDDRFEMLREGLIYLTSFLMDPPHKYAEDEKIILTQTGRLVDEAASLICSFCRGKLREDIVEGRNILLHDLLVKINRAKEELQQLLVETPCLPWNNVPQTNRRGFFDFLLENLKKKSEAEADLFLFEKYQIAILQRELISLRPFLMEIFDLQDEHEELKDIWFKASNVAYLVDQVTDSCLSFAAPIWSNLMHLSNAREQIQFVKTQVTKIRKNQMYNNRAINDKMNSKLVLPRQDQANVPTKDDIMVGFTDEETRIFDRLTGGDHELDIVAIVGMPGQGKTTLARRVFHDSRVQSHFHKCAWCCISQAYDIKQKLLEILKDVDKPVPEKEVPKITREDLAERLYKCLKGKRYVVVLDDIWDIKAWKELQESFPNDMNGSRIFLTSRIHNVPLEAKPNCCLVELHPLSYEESWTLLKAKLFDEDGYPPIFSDIGKKIAENCKGLPLAIVVVAGLLKKDENVDSWNQIAECLNSRLVNEGCMNILELSYQHLPDFLRPCFLYLGAFREDQIIDAKILMQLWIAEGFVQNEGMKSLEVVAKGYLKDLVDRNLVLVAKRSSRYGIKKCRVHDLLHELCLVRAKEERFLLEPDVFVHCSTIRYDHYRLCVHNKWRSFLDSKPIAPNVRSLLVSDQLDMWSSLDHGFTRFELLRILNLDGVAIGSDGIKEIIELLHLRFLSVYGHSIPPSIVNLSRLEVFHFTNVKWYTVMEIPRVLLEMTNLRHIFMRGGCLLEGRDDEKLDLSPPLTNLETFTFCPFDNKSDFEVVAQKLPNIRKLGVQLNGFCVPFSSYFNKLESLKLNITTDISSTTLDFPSLLKKLNLTGYMISGVTISLIGKLSNLEVLKLKVDFEDKRWDVEDDDFLNLKYLKLSSSNIQEWNASEGCFPLLEQFVLKDYDELRELPCGFEVIPTLKRIGVRRCNPAVSSSFEHIVNEQKDNGNEGLQILFVEPEGEEMKLFRIDLS